MVNKREQQPLKEEAGLGMANVEKKGLVVFDVEGVLIPKKRYVFFQLGRTLGFPQFVRIIVWGFLYELGLVPLKSSLTHIFRAFKGLKVEEIRKDFMELPLLPGVREVFTELSDEGWKTALISSGLPTMVVRDLASTLNANYAYGFELGIEADAATGEVWGDVIEHDGKLPVLEGILKTEQIGYADCVVVADDRNNASIFLPEILKIGYDPDFMIRTKANRVLTGDLPEILPVIRGEPKQGLTPITRNDLRREVIHAAGFSIPVFAGFAGVYPVALFIFVLMLIYTISELARMESRDLPIISQITRHSATHMELYEFASAPIFFALGILLTLLLYPAPASSAAIAIFCFGDSAASICGKAFGKNMLRFNKGKTVEGSTFGFVFALAGALFFISPLRALIGAALAMAVESLPLPVNDNLVTPLVTGLVLTLTL